MSSCKMSISKKMINIEDKNNNITKQQITTQVVEAMEEEFFVMGAVIIIPAVCVFVQCLAFTILDRHIVVIPTPFGVALLTAVKFNVALIVVLYVEILIAAHAWNSAMYVHVVSILAYATASKIVQSANSAKTFNACLPFPVMRAVVHALYVKVVISVSAWEIAVKILGNVLETVGRPVGLLVNAYAVFAKCLNDK